MTSLRKNSNASTTCSTPPPHDIYSIIVAEENRYKRKGYGLFTAFLIAVCFFYFAPILCQVLWPPFLKMIEENQWIHWKVYFAGTILHHTFWIIASNLFMFVIYHIELPFFERYKINKMKWPWQENKEEWIKLVKKSIMLVSFNGLVSLPIIILFFLYLDNWEVQYSFAVEDLPDWKTLMLTVTFCMICDDLSFHFTHRLFHWRVIYPYFHKIHHTYVTTVGIAAEYTHPVEFMIGSIIPGSLGCLLLGKRVHFVTFILWGIVRICETQDGHCGYDFSWSPYRLIPFSTSASYHDFHHSHNVGNYSSFFSFWDTIFGQNKAYYQYQERMKEAQENHERRKQEFNKLLAEKLAEKEIGLKEE